MSKRPVLQMVVCWAVLTAIGIVLAFVIPWFPSEASRQAGNIRTLYRVLMIASVPIFTLVFTVVLFAVWRYHMRPGEELKDGPPIHGNTRLEVVWTVAPAILIVGLCTYAYTVLRSNENTKANELTVNVTARQFAFEFGYPQSGGQQVLSPALYLPLGRPVVFKIRSYDVVHSFFVPNFSEKLDAVPGIVTTLRVTPTKTGSYPVECTELCGAGHGLMRAAVYVVSPARFSAWLNAQRPGAPPVGTPPAQINQAVPGYAPAASAASAPASSSSSAAAATAPAAGQAVFTGPGGCAACHTLAAAGSTGTVGPNLTQRLASDCATPASKKIRGATLRQCISTAITHPYAYIPSGYRAGVMPPNFSQTLSSTQIQALVNFLASVTK